MIEGLRLTMTGAEVRRLLEERATAHLRRAAHWKREAARTPEEETDEDPRMPAHICENEGERYEWRAAVMEFLRDHIEPHEVYRLGEADLEFGELLPERPSVVEQEEWDQRRGVGFQLERIAKGVSGLSFDALMMARSTEQPDVS